MQKILNLYKDAYGGLSDASWMLALVMLINRTGSMVLPFLSIYLTQSLDMGIADAGIILTMYGAGAMVGSLLGGWLSDRIGNFIVQFLSLVLGGIFFLFLPMVTEFESLLVAIFIVSLTVEILRPANTASIASYSKPENVTRSYSLNRMAINLGFSLGPAFGGLLASFSYDLLFYVDGFTCIAAGIFFFIYFKNKKPHSVPDEEKDVEVKGGSPYKDLSYLLFIVLVTIFAILFFQLFNTIPLFYREVHLLSESWIGILLGLNGLLVFIFEMVLVHHLEHRVPIFRIIVWGSFCLGTSFILLNLSTGIALLIISMIFLSFAEILAMPFMVTHVIKRTNKANRGAYIGLYSFTWASAFMIAPFLGTRIVTFGGFSYLWWICALMGAVISLLFYLNLKKSGRKHQLVSNKEREGEPINQAINP